MKIGMDSPASATINGEGTKEVNGTPFYRKLVLIDVTTVPGNGNLVYVVGKQAREWKAYPT